MGIPDTGGQIKQEDRDLNLDIDKIRRVEYTMRKFDQQKTKERAKSVADRGIVVPYCPCTRNCENFSTICVAGNDDIDVKLSDSRTQQGRSFFTGVFHCFCLGSRFARSLISIFLYITFVAGNNIIDIVPKSSAAVFSDMCKINATTAKGAIDHRICHLEIQAIFVGAYLLYLVLYICLIWSARFRCRRCKTKSVITAVSRFLLYCLFELLLIMVEPLVFTKIKLWVLDNIKGRIQLGRFVLVVIALVKSAIECTLIYWIANFAASAIPKYLVKKNSIDATGNIQKGDVIFWNRGTFQCSVDAIVADVNIKEDSDNKVVDLIYEESCSWTLCCSRVAKETGVPADPRRMKVYDFSDFSHKYSSEEVVRNAEASFAENNVHYGPFCWNRSSNFCYATKVKDISCPERFNSCETCIKRVCCC